MWLLWDEQDADVTQGSPTPPATAAPVTLQKEIVWVNYAMQSGLRCWKSRVETNQVRLLAVLGS